MGVRWTVLGVLGGVLAASLAPSQVPAAGAEEPSAAMEHARAIVDDADVVVGAEFVEQPDASSAMTSTTSTAGFPTVPGSYSVLSSGRASRLTEPNVSGSSGDGLGGFSPSRGDTAYDVTVLRVDLDVPAGNNCLVGLDFRFLSEEYPEYVGSRFNDAFIAELDTTTWTTSGSEILAPDNFAFDPDGNPITINTVGSLSMGEEFSTGTTFDGGTPSLTAATPITPGRHSLFLSIFDQGDSSYDSAVLLDNLRLGQVADGACTPGAELAGGDYVALGDSFSSGFGNSPYYAGTNKDDGPNDCQRSPQAYGALVAEELDYKLYDEQGDHWIFRACQGGVTKDFYNPREGGDWGEDPQLDYLGTNAELVTLSIGGNDAEFSRIFKECIFGFELLPWNTCSGDDKVDGELRKSFERLNGGSAGDNERLQAITPLPTLYSDIVEKAPYATRVVMGYPQFFPEGGADTRFRCKGIKRADQAYFFDRTRDLTEKIIMPNAYRYGFLLADPYERFVGHEFCGGDEWFYGVTNPGAVHPTVAGQAAMAETVLEQLLNDPRERFVVEPGETEATRFKVTRRLQSLSAFTQWPGSDVVLTLVSPSGTTYTRGEVPAGAVQENGPTWERLEVPDPEPGEWTIRMFGKDVAPGGEDVYLTMGQQEVPNAAPVARPSVTYDGTTLRLDGSASSDPDGTIGAYRWYVDDGTTETVLDGRTAQTAVAPGTPVAVTLQVTDDRGDSDFALVRLAALDVKPGSASPAPVNPTSNGVTPVAVLSFEGFDATKVALAGLRFGPGKAVPRQAGTSFTDVNGDGRRDLVTHVSTPAMQIARGQTTLCMTGTLPDGSAFEGCDGIRTPGSS